MNFSEKLEHIPSRVLAKLSPLKVTHAANDIKTARCLTNG